jgi:hypothetical protein
MEFVMSLLPHPEISRFDRAMSALPPIPEARDGIPKACQLTTLTAKPAAFSKTLAQSARRALWRTGDHGIDLVGIERAVNHQRLGDGEHRRAMLDNERVGFLCTELKIGIDRGF